MSLVAAPGRPWQPFPEVVLEEFPVWGRRKRLWEAVLVSWGCPEPCLHRWGCGWDWGLQASPSRLSRQFPWAQARVPASSGPHSCSCTLRVEPPWEACVRTCDSVQGPGSVPLLGGCAVPPGSTLGIRATAIRILDKLHFSLWSFSILCVCSKPLMVAIFFFFLGDFFANPIYLPLLWKLLFWKGKKLYFAFQNHK